MQRLVIASLSPSTVLRGHGYVDINDMVYNLHQEYKDAQSTLFQCRLVAKCWAEDSDRELWRTVLFTSSSQILKFTKAVKNLPWIAPYVRTVIIAGCWSPVNVDDALQLLQLTTRIERFFFVGETLTDEHGTKAEETFAWLSHSKTLRTLVWAGGFGVREISGFSALAQLTHLVIQHERWPSLRNSSEAPPLDLPALLSLSIPLFGDYFGVAASWVMPRLQNLDMSCTGWDAHPFPRAAFCDFLARYGYQLRQLGVSAGPFCIVEERDEVEEALLSIPEFTPNLLIFVYSFYHFIPRYQLPYSRHDGGFFYGNVTHPLLLSHPGVQEIHITDLQALTPVGWVDSPTEGSHWGNLASDSWTFSELEHEEKRPSRIVMAHRILEALLCSSAFPSLQVVQDLSGQMDLTAGPGVSQATKKFWNDIFELCTKDRSSVVELRTAAGIRMTSFLTVESS
ncbi:hypothetical protein PHLGIDRAFT_123233 [Phlebiopsis gigantea 11061_1 CR5-6]|uniref:Uncharacterized protein n=1 Tax=Phlebiopsis gigantea (strain 11061_1 CR5-6) TaxID=745531 RepID=A0A0C3RZ13_PHLG1|nr:hypothetical protein PHLGIDRAFT_123233 [Phlebiopsis gigantea 11061_1 CR5-6]